MSETIPFDTPPHESFVFTADTVGGQQGIEDGDLDFEAKRTAESILGAHMPEYDNYVGAARSFVKDELGMVDARPVDRVAVLSAETAEAWGSGSNGGHYMPELDVAYVFEQSGERVKTNKLITVSSLVHEIAHSATVTPESVRGENPFYHEAVAGIAEFFALENLAQAGEFDPAPDATMTRVIDGEEMTIVVPSGFRRVDAAETIEGRADSTQALIAAMVVGMGLKRNGQSARDLLSIARRGDSSAYELMREAVTSIDPSLVDDIAQSNGSTDEIIKIAHKAQQTVGMI